MICLPLILFIFLKEEKKKQFYTGFFGSCCNTVTYTAGAV